MLGGPLLDLQFLAAGASLQQAALRLRWWRRRHEARASVRLGWTSAGLGAGLLLWSWVTGEEAGWWLLPGGALLAGWAFVVAAPALAVGRWRRSPSAVAPGVTSDGAGTENLRGESLTGLPNRAELVRAAQGRLDRGGEFALLVVDLDSFKEVNDALGYPVGDAVLLEVAHRLGGSIRSGDMLAHLGGDNFSVLVSGGLETVKKVVRRLLASLRPPIIVDGISVTVQASIGIARGPGDGPDGHTLLRRSEGAMYRAKVRGGSWSLHVIDEDVTQARRLQLASQLAGALATRQIEVHFQPTVDTMSGRCFMLEALVRWRHPKYGLICPDEFVPLAEHHGLGLALFRRVLRSALSQCSDWRRRGLAQAVSVNISPQTLLDPQAFSAVASALSSAQVPPNALVLELTEEAFVGDMGQLLTALNRIRSLGVGLAIDDFGAGYSSLAYLRHLPVDVVKLDRAFASGLGSDPACEAIIALSVELSHRLELTVIAEGVETEAAFDALRRHGCDIAQGYWICRPSTATEITGWLASAKRPGLRSGAAGLLEV